VQRTPRSRLDWNFHHTAQQFSIGPARQKSRTQSFSGHDDTRTLATEGKRCARRVEEARQVVAVVGRLLRFSGASGIVKPRPWYPKLGATTTSRAAGFHATLGSMSSVVAREVDGALIVDVLVQPRASRAGVGPVVGDRLRVSVTAPPVDGKANAAVIEAVAEAFGVRRAAVSIVRGEAGRRKTVRIAGVGRAALVKVGV
jgi:uncharacterized protein (TIGR00251 family)